MRTVAQKVLRELRSKPYTLTPNRIMADLHDSMSAQDDGRQITVTFTDGSTLSILFKEGGEVETKVFHVEQG